jgi:hypothetical protein
MIFPSVTFFVTFYGPFLSLSIRYTPIFVTGTTVEFDKSLISLRNHSWHMPSNYPFRKRRVDKEECR